MQKVRSITKMENYPDLSARNIDVIYSDSAIVQIRLKAPVMKRYTDKKFPFTEFPKGLQAFFFNRSQIVESSISCKYAKYFESKELWEAKSNVIVKNLKEGNLLNTEQLFWDQKKGKIYSSKRVKVTTRNEIIYGEGIESDQEFIKWKILKPKGPILFKDE